MTESQTPTNGNLVTAVRERIATAIKTHGAVPGRRALAADLGVSDYRIRQALTHLDPAAPTPTPHTDGGRPRALRWPLLLWPRPPLPGQASAPVAESGAPSTIR